MLRYSSNESLGPIPIDYSRQNRQLIKMFWKLKKLIDKEKKKLIKTLAPRAQLALKWETYAEKHKTCPMNDPCETLTNLWIAAGLPQDVPKGPLAPDPLLSL